MGELVRVSGLWIKESRSGKKFFSGKTEQDIPAGSKLLIFRNEKKTEENQPDYTLMLANDQETY